VGDPREKVSDEEHLVVVTVEEEDLWLSNEERTLH